MARWHAVTARLSSGSPWAEGGYLSFCPEEVPKSSPCSKWMQAFSTAWLPPRRGVTDLPHHSRAYAAWKWVLIYGTALRTASHEFLHSCWVHVWTPWCRYERLSIHNFMRIQQLSPHQLWLPQVPSNASGPRILPCHPQECASGHKRY